MHFRGTSGEVFTFILRYFTILCQCLLVILWTNTIRKKIIIMLSDVLTWTPQCPWFWMGVIRDRSSLSLSLSLFYGPKGKRANATILIHTLKPTPCKIHTAYSIPLPQYIQNLPKRTGMYVEFYILVVVKSFSACHCVKNNCFFVFSLPFYSFPPSLSGPYFSVLPG